MVKIVKNNGCFISFEGTDGSGKSTQIKLLFDSLRELGYECICTREPGGTELGEKLRNILKDPALNKVLASETEVLLLQTARAQHVHEVIKPALKQGKIVLCDRYGDSSVAYQGIAMGLGKEKIKELNNFSTTGLTPDLTIILDVKPEEGLKRAEERAPDEEKDRWEEQGSTFQEKVRNAFFELAEDEPKRFKVIKIQETIEETKSIILNEVKNELGIL